MGYRMRLTGLSLSLGVIGVLAAGCGGSSGATPTPTTQAGLEAYTACLAQNGVTLPQTSRGPGASGRPTARPSGGGQGGGGRPGGGGGGLGTQAPAGVDQATWDKAQTACASVRPTAGPGGNGGNNPANTAYNNCLSDHGVTATTGPNRLNTSDPTIAAAAKACEPLRPAAPTN